MEITVQMRKNRPSTASTASTTSSNIDDVDMRSATDHGRRLIRPTMDVANEGNAASVLEPQESTIRASDGGSSSSTTATTSSSTQDGINGVLDAMYASGVELGQDVRRARLSADGIENIAISFVGGTTMPATGK